MPVKLYGLSVNTAERDTVGPFSDSRRLYQGELLLGSMAVLPRMLLREPDGRRKGLIFFLLSSISLLGWVYSGVVLDGFHFFLFVGLALALSGVAESLPPDRQRSAGRLRIVAVGILVVFLVLLASVPELLLD